MEYDVSSIPIFLQSPKNSLKDDRFSPQSTAHFFGGCNGHGGSQMDSMRDGSSSDESDDEEEFRDGSDEDTPRLIAKAKEKTLKALEDDELPNAVLMSLPFMINVHLRSMKSGKILMEKTLKKTVNVSGRRVFGATAKVEAPKESRKDSDNFYDDSDSDNDMAGIEDNNIEPVRDNASPATNTITETEKFDDDVAGNPAYKTTFDVAMFASGSWKKMTGSKNTESKKASKKTCASIPQAQDKKDSESEAEQMVDRVLASASKETFVVPSQAELINRAFSGDDVLDEFEKDKDEFLNQEVPIYTYIRYLCLSTHNLRSVVKKTNSICAKMCSNINFKALFWFDFIFN
ncbi:unnamed protein product [Brassica napus]|uniref:(rape) hypothetical protein n=1 Tax=Brassica napus TaxID=3708 RepID=A0A817AD82_BRANA|nr:unnamed protein product [Brassica napus]